MKPGFALRTASGTSSSTPQSCIDAFTRLEILPINTDRFAILFGAMRVLFAILVVACAGLLWATIAAAQHIRRARRQRRGMASPPPSIQSQQELPSVPALNPSSKANPRPPFMRAKQLQTHF